MSIFEFLNQSVTVVIVLGLILVMILSAEYLKEYVHKLYNIYFDSLQSEREKLLQQIKEDDRPIKILELRLNQGENLYYYPEQCELLVLAATCEQAERALRTRCCQYAHVEPRPRTLKHLDDGEVDVVVGTSALCRCDDQRTLLAEIYRVLAPNGKYIFIEHINDKGINPLPYVVRELASLLGQNCFSDMCHLNSEPTQLLKEVGFRKLELKNITIDSHMWVLRLIRNHVVGVAIK